MNPVNIIINICIYCLISIPHYEFSRLLDIMNIKPLSLYFFILSFTSSTLCPPPLSLPLSLSLSLYVLSHPLSLSLSLSVPSLSHLSLSHSLLSLIRHLLSLTLSLFLSHPLYLSHPSLLFLSSNPLSPLLSKFPLSSLPSTLSLSPSHSTLTISFLSSIILCLLIYSLHDHSPLAPGFLYRFLRKPSFYSTCLFVTFSYSLSIFRSVKVFSSLISSNVL